MKHVKGTRIIDYQIHQENRSLTLEVFGRQDDGAEVVVLNEAPDLRRNLGAIPPHEQHLPYRPIAGKRKYVSS